MANESTQERLKHLRAEKRKIEKEIKQHTSASRMDTYMAEWKTISDLKQKFIKELKAHPQLGRMSWNRFASSDDFFLYALHKGLYTHKSVNRDDPWIADAIKDGKTEAELIANATRMREARWTRDERARNKKRKARAKAFDKSNPLGVEDAAASHRSTMRNRGVG